MSDDESQHSSSEESEDEREQEERKRREEETRHEEAIKEREKKAQDKQKQEAEASKKQRKTGQKRRGLGGLSKEKKRLLKQLIMQKAAEIMKAERKKDQEKRDEFVRNKIGVLKADGMSESDLQNKLKELHAALRQIEGEKYDWEEKLRRQDVEIIEMTVKANDNKGKFIKPVLKKVSKTESHLTRFEKKETSLHSLSSFRNQLKSTGHSKFALDEKDESGAKHAKGKEEEAAAAQ